MKRLFFLVLLLAPFVARASEYPRVDEDMRQYDNHVANLDLAFGRIEANPRDKAWVKRKLQHMVDVDQYIRNYGRLIVEHHYSDEEARYFHRQISAKMTEVDTLDREDLKGLLKIYDWFKISEFDEVTDDNAWLIVQHADLDPLFQKRILDILEPLVPLHQTRPAHYAYLFDRVAASFFDVSKRKLQRFGTQGICVRAGTWEPLPVEEPNELDRRRSEYGLESEAAYIARFKDICRADQR